MINIITSLLKHDAEPFSKAEGESIKIEEKEKTELLAIMEQCKTLQVILTSSNLVKPLTP